MLIFPAMTAEEDLEKALETVRGDIARMKGEAGETRVLGRRMFARPIRKKLEGLYVHLAAQLPPDAVAPLKARFKLNPDIFRVQILRHDETGKAASDKTDAEQKPEPAEVSENG